MKKEDMQLKLEADCNSLNAIATSLRHEGKNDEADCLLSIERHIFELIDDKKVFLCEYYCTTKEIGAYELEYHPTMDYTSSMEVKESDLFENYGFSTLVVYVLSNNKGKR